MNISLLRKLAGVVAVASLLVVSTATATPILIAYSSAIPTNPSNNGAALAPWASASISTYNTQNSTSLPPLPAQTFFVGPGDANPIGAIYNGSTKSISLNVTGITYIVLAWGGSNVDNGTLDYLYYINGTTGNFTFTNNPTNADPAWASGGLSGIHVFGTSNNTTTVPDSGFTLGLFGLAMISLGAVRARLLKR
jgi:hypothetical protein